jgi:hypothetical protein
MKIHIPSFEDFINENYSHGDSDILQRAYKNGDPTSLKNFKTKFLKGPEFELGGIIHIHGKIEGSLAKETRNIDVYYFDEDDVEETKLISWTCTDKIQGGDSGWKVSNKKGLNGFSDRVESLLDKGKYHSPDYTDAFLVLFDAPDWNKQKGSYILESVSSVGPRIKGGFSFTNLSANDTVQYKGKEWKVTSVGVDGAYIIRDGKQVEVTSIKEIKPIKVKSLQEMAEGDIHFKNIFGYWKSAGAQTKKFVANLLGTKNTENDIHDTLLDMDYEEIQEIEKELKLK